MVRSIPLPSALTKVRESPASTKARILAAAQSVFAARGLEGTSTREIAAAGVNISGLHCPWEAKETLRLVSLVHTLRREEKSRSRR